jgi:hypothetical protein
MDSGSPRQKENKGVYDEGLITINFLPTEICSRLPMGRAATYATWTTGIFEMVRVCGVGPRVLGDLRILAVRIGVQRGGDLIVLG